MGNNIMDKAKNLAAIVGGSLYTTASAKCANAVYVTGDNANWSALNEQFQQFFHQNYATLDDALIAILAVAAAQGVTLACKGAKGLYHDFASYNRSKPSG